MNRLTFDPEEDQWKFQPLVQLERSVQKLVYLSVSMFQIIALIGLFSLFVQ